MGKSGKQYPHSAGCGVGIIIKNSILANSYIIVNPVIPV
jgi:hypothetical protein